MTEARNIIPLFSTASSRKEGGIFTVEKAGEKLKQKKTRGPVSLCDLAKEENLKRLHLVSSNWIDFMSAHKNLKEIGCDLHFGLKLVICDDMNDKSEASFKTESKVIIWLAGDGDTDYERLINIFTRAANEGFYYVPRLDWKTLCEMWRDNLLLSLPFYSSFLAKNTLTFSSIAPTLPVTPLVLREVGQQIPFDFLLESTIEKYAKATSAQIQDVKTIYYKEREDAKPWQVWREILERTTHAKPNMEHCCSREFSWASFKEMMQ